MDLMPLVRAYALRRARLEPYDGGAPVIPPDPDTGQGGGGGAPGTGTGMLVGAAIDPPNLEGFQAANSTMGPWSVRRGFDSAGFPSGGWAASRSGVDVGRWASVWSGKPDPVQMASGALDSVARAFLQSIPDSHTAFVSIWHEADVKLKQQTAPYTASQYKAAWRRFFTLVREAQATKPNLYGCLIFGSYIYISPRTGVTLDDLWPGTGADGRPYVDCIAFDGYSFTGAESGTHMWGTGREYADSKGVAWGIAEAGLATDVTSGSAGAAWMQTQADYAATHGAGPHKSAAFLAWFGSTVGGVLQTPQHYAETRTRSGLIAQQYFTPYTSYRL